MQPKSILDIEKEYELELEKVIRNIKRQKARKVLLQFPDGLKPYSTIIAEEVEKRAGKAGKEVECLIWLGSCFGACDVPLQVSKLGVDLIVQFGHSAWKFKRKEIKVL